MCFFQDVLYFTASYCSPCCTGFHFLVIQHIGKLRQREQDTVFLDTTHQNWTRLYYWSKCHTVQGKKNIPVKAPDTCLLFFLFLHFVASRLFPPLSLTNIMCRTAEMTFRETANCKERKPTVHYLGLTAVLYLWVQEKWMMRHEDKLQMHQHTSVSNLIVLKWPNRWDP